MTILYSTGTLCHAVARAPTTLAAGSVSLHSSAWRVPTSSRLETKTLRVMNGIGTFLLPQAQRLWLHIVRHLLPSHGVRVMWISRSMHGCLRHQLPPLSRHGTIWRNLPLSLHVGHARGGQSRRSGRRRPRRWRSTRVRPLQHDGRL